MRIRPAVLTDAPAVSVLYAAHVLTGTASFEIQPPDAAEIEQRMKAVLDRGHPWIVAEAEDGPLLGYAYASLFHPRAAYAHTFENSVYLASDAQGQGLGKALMQALIPLCRDAGARQIIALIGDSGNAASIALHKKLGFRHVGVITDVGEKFGQLLDVVYMQLSLQ